MVLDPYVGKYETLAGPDIPPGLEVCIEKIEDFLVLYIPEAGLEADFYPETETMFFTGLQAVRLVFQTQEGSVTGLSLHIPATGETLEASRVPG